MKVVSAIDVLAFLATGRGESLYIESAELKRAGNRIQKVGAHLETFVKIAVEGAGGTLSYKGNANNPPDLMIRNGEAWEIKKTGVNSKELQLNSSSPKRSLEATCSKIASAARACETWTEKDLVYVVGECKEDDLKRLTFCYGDILCASNEIYDAMDERVKDAIKATSLDTTTTKELGRINRIDPLGRASLRIRGMWLLATPYKVFSSYFDSNADSNLFLLAKEDRFEKWLREGGVLPNAVKVQRLTAKEPDNGAQTISVVMLSGRL